MNIKLVNIENGIQGIGFRRVSGLMKGLHPETKTYFVSPDNQFSLLNRILLKSHSGLGDEDLACVADHLADADLLGFSLMSENRGIAARLAAMIRSRNPRVLIVSGGAHGRIYPEDALGFSDIVCESEGENPMTQLYQRLMAGTDYFDIDGLVFNTPQGIRRNNPSRPTTKEELELLPFMDFALDNQMYHQKTRTMVPTDTTAYLNWLGMNLNIIWTRGCPNKCAYCYNSKFINYHQGYAKLRYPSPRYIVDEIKSVLKLYPFISWVSFIDDGMMSIKLEDLEEFADLYSKEIGLPCLTYGTHPNSVTEEKVRVLVRAGSQFFRMGIQNLSRKVLDIYARKTTLDRIQKSCEALARYSAYTAPPAYDVILDNSFVSREERLEHLRGLRRLPPPYIMNLHSLRIVPGSTLEHNIRSHTDKEILDAKDKNLLHPRATLFNIIHYVLSVVRLPDWLWDRAIQVCADDEREFPRLIVLARFVFLVRRAMGHILRADFSFLSGTGVRFPYFLWRTGILQMIQRSMRRRLKNIPASQK
ncbi:MAG: hypothetical protein A2051_07435 [Desulfovibrionales bacterium GWA2_65_9]|nr:MAG: hypothetical protein A2051_07435 [Desulfovibrionales bacterium GWA2_65_9]